jgi:molybdopterin/thiamine biosynthesis adenylyltransferase
VLAPLAGVIGAQMAMEAIKLLTGIGTPLLGRLMLYDGKAGRMTEVDY